VAVEVAAALAAPERFLLELVFASLRTGAALALLPALGGQLIPVRVRIGLAGAVGFLILSLPARPAPPADLLGVPGLLAVAGELLIGAAAALFLHAAFAAAQVAGEWLAQAMGLGFAMAVSGDGPPLTMLSTLFALLMWSIFLASGGHLLLLQVLVESYRAMPHAGALLEPGRLSMLIGWGGFALASGLMAALPLGVALLLLNIALAVAAKTAPQLNLFSVGFPVMLLVTLIGLPLALPGLTASFASAMVALQGQLGELLLG
jgi:flagellar biosynthetic protein FliR